MAKRKRRERDRPKAGPDAAYNPHKRTLLSYDSDEEDASSAVAGAEHPEALEAVSVDYTIAPYPDEDEEGTDSNEAEGYGYVSVPADEALVEDLQPDTNKTQSRKPKRAPLSQTATGQRIVLGALMDVDEDDEDYDSEGAEAMAYLKAVQNERDALPTIFKAQQVDEHEKIYDNGIGDSRGRFSGDAYIAQPGIGVALPESAKTRIDPQEAYTKALKGRFLAQRELLHATPEAAAIADLDDKHPITLPESSNKAYAEWATLVKTTAPLPAQLQSMDSSTVRRLLDLVRRMHLMRSKVVGGLTSAWIWSLLARLDDVGTMDNDEVYDLRDLGKRAILVQLSFIDPVAAQQLEAVETGGEASSVVDPKVDRDEAEGIHASADGVSDMPVNDSAETENTLATLDMIISIVGHVFGQRDLLEFRRSWDAVDDVRDAG